MIGSQKTNVGLSQCELVIQFGTTPLDMPMATFHFHKAPLLYCLGPVSSSPLNVIKSKAIDDKAPVGLFK